MSQASRHAEDRFNYTRASVYYDAHGRPMNGLPEHATKHVQQHAFEAQKQTENQQTAQKLIPHASAQRHQKHTELETEWDKRKASQGCWEPSNKPASREHMTSKDHPLYAGGFSPASGNFEALPKPCSKRVYKRSELDAARPRLGPTLVPLEGESEFDYDYDYATTHTGSMAGSAMATPADPTAMGDESEEGGQQGDDSTADGVLHGSGKLLLLPDGCVVVSAARPGSSAWGSSSKGSGRSSTSAVTLGVVSEQQRVMDDLLAQYPHGVPKLVQRKLVSQGLLPENVPTLGFGGTAGM